MLRKIVINGKKLEGSVKELAIILRQGPYYKTMQEIGYLLGCTRSNISFALQGTGLNKRINKKSIRLSSELLETMRDEDIQKACSISLDALKAYRKKTGIRGPISLNKIKTRQRILAKLLFGEHYLPGSNFKFCIFQLIERANCTANEKKAISSFYFEGLRSTNSQKVYRYYVVSKLKKYVLSNISEVDYISLLKNNILSED